MAPYPVGVQDTEIDDDADEVDGADDEHKPKTDEEILAEGHRRFKLCVDAEQKQRIDALDDLRFSVGQQWDDNVKILREQDERPCLTINRLPQMIHQITNDEKQAKPAIKVSPVDDAGDIDIAKIRQGLIRHIEYASDADIAYGTAGDFAARMGLGYFRIITEYCNPLSFDQDIRIRQVANPFKVYLDPNYCEPDGKDANFGFEFEDIEASEYRAVWPKSKLTQMADWTSVGDDLPDWINRDTARVCDYLYKDFRPDTLLLLSNGVETVTLLKSEIEKLYPQGIPPEMQLIRERETVVPVIMWIKMNGIEILEKSEWPGDGRWIPIIPVVGEKVDVDGERITSGIVRYAKDSQRMYNYWRSCETETIALAPRAPWIGAAGQFDGFENDWGTANRRNHAYLQYNATDVSGKLIGPPQRNVFEPPVQAISQASLGAAEDIKATTGIYDAAIGNRSNESSGKAIERRVAQAQTSNFHFIDNQAKSIRHGGRIINGMLKKIYDAPRAVRILGEEGEEEIVRINQVWKHKGKDVNYKMDQGEYDVTISTGPSFETRRQEAVSSQMDLAKSWPKVMDVAGDIIVKNMDWPGNNSIAERLRKTLPPGIAEPDDKDKQAPIPPQAQMQMAKQGQMIEQLSQLLKQANEDLKTKSMELESKERIAFAKMEQDAKLKLAELDAKDAQLLLTQQIAEISQRLNLLQINQPIDEPPAGGMAGPPQAAAPMPPPGMMNEQQPAGPPPMLPG